MLGDGLRAPRERLARHEEREPGRELRVEEVVRAHRVGRVRLASGRRLELGAAPPARHRSSRARCLVQPNGGELDCGERLESPASSSGHAANAAPILASGEP